jgi:hypothetical protein
VAVGDALLGQHVLLERCVARDALESLAQRGERCSRRAWRSDRDIGQLSDLVGQPVERIPRRSGGHAAVDLTIEIGERRHFGDELVPLVAAAAIDGDEIGKADPFS